MTTLAKRITPRISPLQHPKDIQNKWHAFACRRLTGVYETAQDVPFNDSSRIVFLSDCHRGDKSRADGFARNEDLFLHALTRYYDDGFTYVEVGDGDDLWKNRRFRDIRHAYVQTFNLLHRFHQQNRLHLILGNHEMLGGRHSWAKKDGIAVHEGLILRHSRTGRRIFAVHGHQADFLSDRFYRVNGFLVQNVWRRLQLIDFWGGTASRGGNGQREKAIRRRITGWLQDHRQIVICGHTHRSTFAAPGEPPYFNTGSCIVPDVITGLEIQHGEIMLIQWSARPGSNGNGARCFERTLLAPPRKLHLLN
jgi:UDP-2,3-diacylglucosamine pyrophosphatase LpxH